MKLKEIHVEGYRSLVDVTLPLRDLMVMIGPNGSGKTALLEVFVLLRHAAQKQLAARLESLGGVQAVLSQTANGPERLKVSLSVDVEGDSGQVGLDYFFELAPRGTGYAFPSERLELTKESPSSKQLFVDAQYDQVGVYDPDLPFEGMSRFRRKGHNPLELALAQVSTHAEARIFHNLLSTIQFYSSLDVGQRAVVRLPQSLIPTRRPGPNGENLYSALYNLRTDDPEAFHRIDELVSIGFPGFEKLEFPVVGAGQVTLAWHQKGISGPLYPNQLSEGMLRFLWLVTILLSPDAPSMILLDEPEVSMHPELLKLLAGALQDAAMHSQILVATHSPDLIRWLEPSQVLVTEKDESGATRFTWADSLDLEAWLKEYTLRDLWLMGTLGGRP
jgi:predicted ATPase